MRGSFRSRDPLPWWTWINISELSMSLTLRFVAFCAAQSRGVEQHQQRPVKQVRRGLNEAGHLIRADLNRQSQNSIDGIN